MSFPYGRTSLSCDVPEDRLQGILVSGIHGYTPDMKPAELVAQADLVCSEGFIEPHFFAGFSGGRKSVLPGVASRTTVMANHCSEFIADVHSRTGILEGNPIHRDMVWAARQARLAFICNVVINADKEVIYAVAGDLVSGEHGIGLDKRKYLVDMLGERQIELMRGIKKVFDPKGILNPGKVI